MKEQRRYYLFSPNGYAAWLCYAIGRRDRQIVKEVERKWTADDFHRVYPEDLKRFRPLLIENMRRIGER